jgi:hypothetical protein
VLLWSLEVEGTVAACSLVLGNPQRALWFGNRCSKLRAADRAEYMFAGRQSCSNKQGLHVSASALRRKQAAARGVWLSLYACWRQGLLWLTDQWFCLLS